MTEELLADSTESASPVEGSDLATDTGETPEEKITFSDDQQKVFDDAIGKKTFKNHQQAREFRDKESQLNSQIAELKAKIPEDVRPVIPEMPDSLDDNFDQQVQVREEAIRQAALFDGKQQAIGEQQQAAALQAQNAQTKEFNDISMGYAQRASTLGIKPEDLQQSGAVLGQMGISDALANQLLSEDTGPLMANYLAANPEVFDRLNSADQWSGGVILQDVRQKVAELKPQHTAAPTPADVLTGGSVPSTKRGPPGAKYE